MRRNCSRLRTRAIVPRGGQKRGNMKSVRNRPGNQANRDGNRNDQRQGHVFEFMARDVRNNEVVVPGNVLICSLPTYLLFDTGSSHTFVSP